MIPAGLLPMPPQPPRHTSILITITTALQVLQLSSSLLSLSTVTRPISVHSQPTRAVILCSFPV